jgi:phosphoribosylglycinamide formyltransferase-1
MRRLKLAVLLSGSGTTLENIFLRCADNSIHADVAVVLSSRAGVFGLERARQRQVPALTVERRKFDSPDTFSSAIYGELAHYAPDLICLAGFMSLLRVPTVFQHRVLNVHPSLLPAFGGKGCYGHKVHEAVLRHGCKVAGCTVHFVDNEYDQGPIILQKAVPVLDTDTPDTLAERVQEAEREIYPQAIELIAQDRLTLTNRTVRIRPA